MNPPGSLQGSADAPEGEPGRFVRFELPVDHLPGLNIEAGRADPRVEVDLMAGIEGMNDGQRSDDDDFEDVLLTYVESALVCESEPVCESVTIQDHP